MSSPVGRVELMLASTLAIVIEELDLQWQKDGVSDWIVLLFHENVPVMSIESIDPASTISCGARSTLSESFVPHRLLAQHAQLKSVMEHGLDGLLS